MPLRLPLNLYWFLNNNDDSLIIDTVAIDTIDDNRMRAKYFLDPTVCLDLNDCGPNAVIFDLNTISWINANNQDLTCM